MTPSPFSLRRHAALAVAATAGTALVHVAGSALGASMHIDSPAYDTITLPLTVGATLLPLLLAGTVAWLLARPLPIVRPIAPWAGLALATLSMVSPFVLAQDLTTALSLALMHVIAGAAWFTGLTPRKDS